MKAGGALDRLRALWRRHVLAYAVVAAILVVANLFVGGGWWSFWPLGLWGLVLALHFLIVKCIDVDEGWVRERTEDLHVRSYDLGHIKDIEKRVEDDDASVRPADKR